MNSGKKPDPVPSHHEKERQDQRQNERDIRRPIWKHFVFPTTPLAHRRNKSQHIAESCSLQQQSIKHKGQCTLRSPPTRMTIAQASFRKA
jgi:hypothetical protein